MLERSNVSIVESMMRILSAQRAYEANAKGVQAADEMLRIGLNLLIRDPSFVDLNSYSGRAIALSTYWDRGTRRGQGMAGPGRVAADPGRARGPRL
jgi:hypothetical protein